MSRNGGFTLLELLVALTLLAALSGVAVPRARVLLQSWQLSAAARQVVMDLKLVRARAIGAGITHRLRFAVPGTAYQQERRSGSGYAAAGPPTQLPDGVQVVECTAGGGGVAFRPRGYAASFGTITLRNRAGHERRVVVDIAGRLRVR
ncbi:MAG: prepilin-type N-terminal cleavage/methylation domain-containing protein [Candidatus Binatia bacterium]